MSIRARRDDGCRNDHQFAATDRLQAFIQIEVKDAVQHVACGARAMALVDEVIVAECAEEQGARFGDALGD